MWSEFLQLSAQGGWIFWALIALAFGILSALIAGGMAAFEDPEVVNFAREQRRLSFCLVMIGAAPLIGLLGTVDGMLISFSGLAGSAAAATPIDTISKGISSALITTQTGLIVAIPTSIAAAMIKRRLRQREGLLSPAPNLTPIAG